jgi:hypothetical protein
LACGTERFPIVSATLICAAERTAGGFAASYWSRPAFAPERRPIVAVEGPFFVRAVIRSV